MLLSVAYTMPFQSPAFCDLQYAISRMPVMFILVNLKKMGKNRNIAINWECKCLFNYDQVFIMGTIYSILLCNQLLPSRPSQTRTSIYIFLLLLVNGNLTQEVGLLYRKVPPQPNKSSSASLMKHNKSIVEGLTLFAGCRCFLLTGICRECAKWFRRLPCRVYTLLPKIYAY